MCLLPILDSRGVQRVEYLGRADREPHNSVCGFSSREVHAARDISDNAFALVARGIAV